MIKAENYKKNEARIQQDIVRFYRNFYCLAHHSPRCLIISVPNEGNPRLYQLGALPGCSDLIAIHRNTEVGKPIISFIEIKSKIGQQSPKQVKFQEWVEGMGFPYHIVRSLDDFKSIVETWKNQ